MNHLELAADIERYCRDRGIRESYFGQMAVQDRNFVNRLRRGRVMIATMQRAKDYLDEAAAKLKQQQEETSAHGGDGRFQGRS